jgi:hypothetical protein
LHLQTFNCNQRMQTVQLQRSLLELCIVNWIDFNFLGAFIVQGAQLHFCVTVYFITESSDFLYACLFISHNFVNIKQSSLFIDCTRSHCLSPRRCIHVTRTMMNHVQSRTVRKNTNEAMRFQWQFRCILFHIIRQPQM